MSIDGINPNSAADARDAGPRFTDILAGLRAQLGTILCVTALLIGLFVARPLIARMFAPNANYSGCHPRQDPLHFLGRHGSHTRGRLRIR